jgi:2-methylisocitrate lyase-like PEP mutase family enzyme
LEDSVKGSLEPAAVFAKRITTIANYLAQKNIPLFINARTDAVLVQHPNAIEETVSRIKQYQSTGAGSIFVPFIKNESDIKTVVAASSLPINVLPVPGLPNIATLTAWGVKRISLGSSLFNAIKKDIANKAKQIMEQQSFDHLF